MNSDELLIGEVASQTGVSVDTIRHYERKGLLQGITRDRSGYRRYPSESITRIRVIRRAISIGFTLDELSRIFRQRASGQPPCGHVRDLAVRKLAELDDRISAMSALRTALAETVETWEQRLRETPRGGFAHLLETLAN